MTDELEESNKFEKFDAIGGKLRGEFKEAQTERRAYEDRWLSNLRMYKGEYEPSLLSTMDANQSKAYIRLGRIKVNTMDARMFDMLYPGGTEKNWEIKPTPKPSVPPAVLEGIVRQMAAENGVAASDLNKDEIQQKVNDWVEKQTNRMSTAISDKLTEGKYRSKGRKVIHSGNLFGTGWLKGTLTDTKNDIAWEYDDENEDYIAKDTSISEPFFEHVPIWDVYPDLSAQTSNVEQCDFIWQRHVMGRHHLRKMAKRAGFNKDGILDYIKSNPKGDASRAHHEEALRNMDKEKSGVKTLRNKFEVLERWGYINAQDLEDCGCEGIKEGDDDVFGVVWLLGDRVIKASLHPGERAKHIFYKYHFEEDETSIFGFGVPDVIRDTQDLANTAIRAAVDNAAITAGPQVEVNLDLLDPAAIEKANELHPFKTWFRRGKGNEATHPAIRVTNVTSHVNELLGLFEAFKMLNDEVSNVPSYMHGESGKGVANTVGGLSMLMGASNITIKDVVANFDEGISIPFITSVYDWLMMFGDKSIKGDVNIRATGSSSLVAREVKANALSQFANDTQNPTDAAFVDRPKLLRERAKILELPDDIVMSEEKTEAFMQEIKSQASEMFAQMLAQSALQQQQEEEAALAATQ